MDLELTRGSHHLPLLLVLVRRRDLHRSELHALAGEVRPGELVAVGQRHLPPVHADHCANVQVCPVPVLPVCSLKNKNNDLFLEILYNVFNWVDHLSPLRLSQ